MRHYRCDTGIVGGYDIFHVACESPGVVFLLWLRIVCEGAMFEASHRFSLAEHGSEKNDWLVSPALAKHPRGRHGVSARRKRVRLLLRHSLPGVPFRPRNKGQLIPAPEIFWIGAQSNPRAVPKVQALLIVTYIGAHNVNYRAVLPYAFHLR